MKHEVMMIVYCLLALSAIGFALVRLRKANLGPRVRWALFVVPVLLTFFIHNSYTIQQAVGRGGFHLITSQILPLYPCHIIMWCTLFLTVMEKNTRAFRTVSEFVFFGGSLCTFLGLVGNFDFWILRDLSLPGVQQTLFSHTCQFFAVLWLYFGGYVKIDLPHNMHALGVLATLFYVCAWWMKGVYMVLDVPESHRVDNLMFFKPPFASMPWATFYTMVPIALAVAFGVIWLIELKIYPKGQRWTDRIKKNK